MLTRWRSFTEQRCHLSLNSADLSLNAVWSNLLPSSDKFREYENTVDTAQTPRAGRATSVYELYYTAVGRAFTYNINGNYVTGFAYNKYHMGMAVAKRQSRHAHVC